MHESDMHPDARLNVLLTEDRPRGEEHWIEQLPRLLEPQGIAAFIARSGEEALDVANRVRIHAAVIDLAVPMARDGRPQSPAVADPAGFKLLQLFRKLPYSPPIVVVHSPVVARRDVDRLLHEALRLGAFSVLARPLQIEQFLGVFRRLVDQKYRGQWPGQEFSTG